jgi:hypothetical protein
MSSEFVLRHGSATTEKALGAADRVEAIFGKILNRNKRAMGELNLEDLALLVQHVRDVSAGPRLEHTWAAAELLARAEAAEQRAGAASAEVEEWRAFAAEVARAVHAGERGQILANHLSVEDLVDLRASLRAALGGAA